MIDRGSSALISGGPLTAVEQKANSLMSKSKLTNYTYRGALASLSKSAKKVLDFERRFIDVSRRVDQTTWCSSSDRTYDHFQVRTQQERTAPRHPARLCSPRRNSRRTDYR